MRIRNRIVTVTENGLEHESRQRHAEILMRGMGIDDGSKEVVTPGASTSDGAQAQEEQARGERLLRAVAARENYLDQDRVGMQFAAKEISGSRRSRRSRTGGVRRG